ncbi:protein kinase [Kitasatospora sp. NPDC058063]|uniref:protein kinase domain-containing protein n=1 Tax=unclassified Kitasatospora TaxID=2633591 RepID=UPI0036DADE0A
MRRRPPVLPLLDQGAIRSAEALRALAPALAVALSGLHRLGLVHRDLKPADIMLTAAGPRLLDFGIAAIVDGTRLTATGGGPGILTYMAPEQFGEERVGPAADVWAWACCVLRGVRGARLQPVRGDQHRSVIRRIVETGPAALAAAQSPAPDPEAVHDQIARAGRPSRCSGGGEPGPGAPDDVRPRTTGRGRVRQGSAGAAQPSDATRPATSRAQSSTEAREVSTTRS